MPLGVSRRVWGQKVARIVDAEDKMGYSSHRRDVRHIEYPDSDRSETLPMISRQRPGRPITSDASDQRHRNPGYAFQS